METLIPVVVKGFFYRRISNFKHCHSGKNKKNNNKLLDLKFICLFHTTTIVNTIIIDA